MRFVLSAAVLLFGLVAAAPRISFAQNEILLNDDRVDRNQWNPHAALGSTGAIVVAWMDGRNGGPGFIDYDTYIMTLRDPLGLGSTINRRLNDDNPGSTQGAPHIASSPSGTFFCAWEDGRAGNRDIYGAALDSLGVAITPNFRINDDAGTADQTTPRIAPVGSNGYVVVWSDGRETKGEIFASYRISSGGPLAANIKISVDPISGGSYQGEPAVAVDGSGRALVAWLDGRAGGTVVGATFDVYAQWLDVSGEPIGGNFKVNDATGTQQCASPVVIADPVLGFVLAWVDARNAPGDPSDVYAQRFDGNGSAVGPNVRVNDDPPGRQQRAVRGAAGPGTSVLIWEDLRGNLGLDSNAEAAFVPYDAGPVGANFRVNSDTGGRQGTPSAVWDGRDAYLAVWEDGRRGSSDVFAVSFFPDATRRGSDSQLNDDAAPFDQRRPRLGRGPGHFLATWIDRRNNSSDLYGQWVTAAGARVGPNHLLWHDDSIDRPVSARGAVAPSGTGLVVAHITRFSDAGDIRGFYYSAAGESADASVPIGDVLPSAQASPSVAARSGGFAVAWIDSRDGAPRIYGQRLAEDGTLQGGNHAVLSVDPADLVTALDLEADPAGGWWLCYIEGTEQEQRLWLTHVSDDLVADGAPLAIAPEVPGSRSDPSVAVGSDGRVEVVWLGPGTSGLGQVYYRSYSSELVALTPLLALGEPSEIGPQAAPSLAIAGAYSVVVWEERAQGNWSIWMQRFQGGSIPVSGVTRVDEDVSGADQLDPAAGMDGSGRAIVIWSDLRSASSGMDILGRVFQFVTTAAEDPPPEPEPAPPPAAPRALRVGAARPNPFSGATAAPIETVAPGRLLARVVNVRGEVIATLHDGPVPALRFTVRWNGLGRDGRPAASGVYWLMVDSGGERRATRLVHLR